jgi:hypothetical protein
LAIVGALVGGGWGYINGRIAGDTGAQLLADSLAGAATGSLIGLTDGLSLLTVAQGATISAGAESLRQISNGAIKSYRNNPDGNLTDCISINRVSIGFAAAASGLGDTLGGLVSLGRMGVVLGRGEFALLSEFEKLGAIYSPNITGALGLPISAIEGSRDGGF